MALTKKDLLTTAKDSKVVEIDRLGGKEVRIRPLNDGEYSEIQNMVTSAMKITKSLSADKLMKAKNTDDLKEQHEVLNDLGINIDFEKMKDIERKSNYLTCKYGLSVGDEEWTEEEVAQLPTGVPSEISDKIMEYTGVNKLDEVENFRK